MKKREPTKSPLMLTPSKVSEVGSGTAADSEKAPLPVAEAPDVVRTPARLVAPEKFVAVKVKLFRPVPGENWAKLYPVRESVVKAVTKPARFKKSGRAVSVDPVVKS